MWNISSSTVQSTYIRYVRYNTEVLYYYDSCDLHLTNVSHKMCWCVYDIPNLHNKLYMPYSNNSLVAAIKHNYTQISAAIMSSLPIVQKKLRLTYALNF